MVGHVLNIKRKVKMPKRRPKSRQEQQLRKKVTEINMGVN
jgi:hypothetical protein